ncbi:uncharacterized protein [Erythrolamprus reginae]|uniref:uncharacterized protein isoform X3 n=1 Tax=Erythrolamprus reginae TaxID=121349 RepID=UPI00396C2D47
MPSQEITDSQRPSARRLPEVQLADYEDYNDHCCYLRGPPERQARSTFPACAGCRGQHQRSRCPFKDAFCYRCEKRGHIAAACRAALPDDNSSPQGQQPSFPAPRAYRPRPTGFPPALECQREFRKDKQEPGTS